ncbi:uncharacterized protein LOC119101758 [Pollicipes pollicipes]|uniref:uncharacterized protein LOC119101758 n=1 Tax=Pollicipes pollicipes TaxID=41117 RepID=UPI00188493CE|nr:uncharacterized protein LOC119101758 [Pollicipes pollicipes]
MYGVTLLLLVLGWHALFGLASGDILGHDPAGVGPADRPSAEAVQLQISIPIAADQLLQLASASPDAWRQILAQTPPAARRSPAGAAHRPRRADGQQAARRSHSTLGADGSGYRRLARRERPSSKYDAPTGRSQSVYRTTLNDLDRPSSSYGPPSREPARPSSSYRPPARGLDRPASSYSSPFGVFDGPSSEYQSPSDSFHSSVLKYRTSAASAAPVPHSWYTPPTSRYESSSPSRGASPGSYATPRPAAPRVTTYRPPKQGYSTPVVGPAASGYGGEHGQEELHEHGGLDWLRDVVPGLPGEDYPVLGNIPLTSFSCAGRPEGYFTDVATRCQVYHVCHGPFRMSSFLCPNGTVFSQSLATCDWWFNTECSEDLPLPSSTFREGRHMSGYMFEDDWIDDYEDFDAADYRPPTNSYRPPAKSYRPPPPRDSRHSSGDSRHFIRRLAPFIRRLAPLVRRVVHLVPPACISSCGLVPRPLGRA